METVRVIDPATTRPLLERVELAEGLADRFLGLMGRAALDEDCGMFFPRCSSIHMFFMRFPIDAVYVDTDRRVRKIVADLKPWRLSWCPAAYGVLEAPAGWAARVGLSEGMRLQFEETGEALR
jgi:uncharacterized membrane protein (UPF0127 family)